jgi:Asp-tRNA(Asn)/Glu-tRNA(Gln) amidotransferase A subunit family amidase
MAYDLKPVRAPKLRGLGLRFFTALLESRLFRPLLLPSLLRNTGVARFRKHLSQAAPTNFPLVGYDESPARETPQHEGADAGEAVAATMFESRAPQFRFASITDYARAYRDQCISPEEVGQRIIASIESSNRADLPLRAIIKFDAEDIQRQAVESAERLALGRPRSILEGVPVAIKDELDMPPYSTHVGTRFLGKEIAGEDATAVSRLRAAGALLVGKSNMFEIGISPTGNNPIHGFARNPYNLKHDAGGSSGGSGASVGSGIVPLAIGTDGGGSIRIPAAHCGVVGLKPTFGRVSEFGAAPLCWSVAHVGQIGATALDTAIGYAISSGRDPKDPMSLGQPPVHLHDFHKCDLSGVTLGIYPVWFEDASAEIVQRCRETLQVLEAAGAVVKDVSIAGLEETRVGHAITILTEMATAMEPHYAKHRKDFGHATRVNLALGRKFTSRDYVLAQRVRTESMREWDRILSEVDAVMTPTTACASPYLDPRTLRYGESDMGMLTELMRFVVCANFCGLPAISFPAGYTREGLPIGMQAIGRHWEENLLLRLANVADQNLDRKKPAAYHEILSAEDADDQLPARSESKTIK